MYRYLIFTYFLAVWRIASALPLYTGSVQLSEGLTGVETVQVSTPLLNTGLAASLHKLGSSTVLSTHSPVRTLLDLTGCFSETYTGLAMSSTEHSAGSLMIALPTEKEQGHFLAGQAGILTGMRRRHNTSW
jgi:hypothetical protein